MKEARLLEVVEEVGIFAELADCRRMLVDFAVQSIVDSTGHQTSHRIDSTAAAVVAQGSNLLVAEVARVNNQAAVEEAQSLALDWVMQH